MTSAASRVWLSWTAGNPEPDGLTIVRDASGVVSYTDTPEWRREPVTGIWRGYKGGEKTSRDWASLLDEFGPVTGALGPRPVQLVDPAPTPPLFYGVIPV